MKIQEILDRRKKAVYKSDILGVTYDGSKYMKQVLINTIDYLPDIMGTIVNMRYEEVQTNSFKDADYRIKALLGNVNTDNKLKIINWFNITSKDNCDMLRLDLSIEDTNDEHGKNTVPQIEVKLFILNNDYVQLRDMSLLAITITYCMDVNEKTDEVKLGTLTRWVFGNEAVERVLNRQHKLYESMLIDWEYYKAKSNSTSYDDANNIITYKGEHFFQL